MSSVSAPESIHFMAFVSMSAIITLRLWGSSQVSNTHIKQAHTHLGGRSMNLTRKRGVHMETEVGIAAGCDAEYRMKPERFSSKTRAGGF